MVFCGLGRIAGKSIILLNAGLPGFDKVKKS
jgi:flagellar assembly factor FliW